MNNHLNKLQNNLDKLKAIYGHIVLPELPDGTLQIYISGEEPSIHFNCPSQAYSEQEDAEVISNRDRVLDLVATLFGKEGWIRTREYSNKYFHWDKKVDNIDISIKYAERVPLPIDKTPVSPKSFPLLLQ